MLLFYELFSSLKMEHLKTTPFGKSGLDSSPIPCSDNIKRQNRVGRSKAVRI